MPRDGAMTFADIGPGIDTLHVACERCGRRGRYQLARLVARYGRDFKVPDFVHAIAGDCPRRNIEHFSDYCRARIVEDFAGAAPTDRA